MPAPERASASAGSSESGSPVSFAIVAGSPDSATSRPSFRAGPSAGSHAPPATAALDKGRTARRIDRRRDAHRLQGALVVQPQQVGSGHNGEGGRRSGGPFAFGGGQPLIPRAREHRAEEVLARERDV